MKFRLGSQFTRGTRQVGIGTLSGFIGVFFAFSLANAELPASEFSEDPGAQVLSQIETMLAQENAALAALNADRLAELGGMRTEKPSGDAPRFSSVSIFGLNLGGQADEDINANDLARNGQGRTGELGEHPTAAFTKIVLDGMPEVSGDRQWKCLTEALYFEARSESIEGQFAVGEVILNRVDSRRFPDTVCGVVTQGANRLNACQFSYNCDGKAEHFSEPKAFERAGKLAKMMLDGRARVLTGGATFYHTSAVSPRWARSFTTTARIGAHIFYRQ